MKTYFNQIDFDALLTEYPIGQAFIQRYTTISRDQLRQQQESRFIRIIDRGWQIPFYQRLWRNEGLEPGDITGLEDIVKLPVYDKSDIMASIERSPPFGDFAGWSPQDSTDQPVIFHTTSGTTGKPQTLLFGVKGREVGNLLVSRMYQWQGLQHNDIVHSVYGHGTINGGHYIREAVSHFTNSLFISAGTGAETPSVRQVELMRDFGATVILGFVDYIRKLADTAREQGMIPGEDIRIRMISGHLGMEDRRSVETAWGGATAYDWYGVGDTGCIAGEGPDRDGLYVWEDAHYLELLDVSTGQSVASGDKGDMVCTCVYKDDIFPIIRFNTHDVSAERLGSNDTGMVFKRIEGFLGRSDNMIKLRGINIFPHSVGQILQHEPAFNGEFVCIAERDDSARDELLVLVECDQPDHSELQQRFATLLKNGFGIAVNVQLVASGLTAQYTQINHRQKPIRLVDRRHS